MRVATQRKPLIAAFVLFLSMSLRAGAGELSSDPVIQLDTQMHNSPVYMMSVDASARFAVSAAEKQVRVWSLPEGKLVRTIRPPVAEGVEGNIVAVAISSDGETVACGGDTSTDVNNYHVYLFSRSSGKMVRRLVGFPGRIRSLVYSPDGKTLAVGSLKGGIRTFNAATYAPAGTAAEFPGDARSMDYDRSGRLIASSSQGDIVLYDPSLKVISRAKTRSGNWETVRFSPDGKLVAVGSNNGLNVEVLSGDSLQHLYSPALSDLKGGGLGAVGWSADGRKLFAAGSAQIEGRRVVGVFEDAGRGSVRWIKAANDFITVVRSTADGFVYSSGEPSLGALTMEGRRIFNRTDVGIGYRDKTVRVSEDGSLVGVVFPNRTMQYRFSLVDGDFDEAAGRDGELADPVRSAPGINVTGLRTREPKLNGQRLGIDQGDVARSMAVVPGGEAFIVGGDFTLYRFETGGRMIWKRRLTATPWAVNVSRNGKVAVVGASDGTIRWYRVSDGVELAALYRVAKFDGPRKPWVVWSAKGYYSASPGADSLIGWHVNNGWDREAYFYAAARFRRVYYRPDIFAYLMKTCDESAALKLAGGQAAATSITGVLPPIVRIFSPADGAQIAAGSVPVRYSVESPTGDPITSVRILVDGRPVPQARDIVLEAAPARTTPAQSAGKNVTNRTADVPVDGAQGTITIIAMTKNGASEPASVRVVRKGAASAPADGYTIKPKLYILSVGVSRYNKHPENNLKFAAKDATDFAAAMASQKGRLYREVSAKVLTDGQATRANVVDGLQWLKRSATQHDVAMIFMSSHGDNSSGQYYFIPSDFDKARLESTSVLFTYIKDAVASIPGKVVVFMDTCHAGDVLGNRGTKAIPPSIDGIVNELVSAENGAVVFTSSTGRQQSLEDPKWNNGAFTRALVDGLTGKADLTGKGRITINMLDVYISERVKELTQGKQTPTTAKPQTIQDFPIAVR